MIICKFPQLTPLQKRFAASLLALCLMGLVFWSLGNPHFAYAAELESGEDHNWHRLQEELELRWESDGVQGLGNDGEVEGLGEGKEVVWRRQEESSSISGNDAPNNLNAVPGQTEIWKYGGALLEAKHADRGTGLPNVIGEKAVDGNERHKELRRRDGHEGELGKRQAATQVYISMNTCLQPTYNGTGIQTAAPPQLTLYIAMTSDNQAPGPGSSNPNQEILPLDEGFVNYTLSVSGDVYMAVHAPPLPKDFTGGWNYDIAVSIDDYYHHADNSTPFLYLVDSDTNAALLVTDSLTQAEPSSTQYQGWMNLTSPFIMFASNANTTNDFGLSKSFCGLQNNAQIQAQQADSVGTLSHIQMGMITRGLGDKPKQQFYITNLNGSSTYIGTLAMPGNSTASGPGVVGGGGRVWQAMNWTTKADGNCQLMFNLTFCDKVAYAVPSNPTTYPNRDNLQAVYDHYAASVYTNFTYSLAQVPCDTTSDAQYSLAKNCTDCSNAYKEWLCAVTIPRCEDWSNDQPFLQRRNMAQPFINSSSLPDSLLSQPYTDLMTGAPTLYGSPAHIQTFNSTFATNQSRNHQIIDLQVMPGPYKEVLPCEDLCYSLMQSCPAALGFGCPQRGRGLEEAYGRRSDDAGLTCSYLGAVYYFNAAGTMAPAIWAAVGLAALVGLGLGV